MDTYHGYTIVDLYRFLEDSDSPDTQTWIAEQRKQIETYLKARPFIQIRDDLTRFWSYATCSLPHKYGKHYYFWYNNGHQQYDTLMLKNSLYNEPICCFDLNMSNHQEEMRLSSTSLSKDGTLLAYGLASHGNDWQTIHICQIPDTGRERPDEVILGTRARGNIVWQNKGFYYGYYATQPSSEHARRNCIYFHKVGTPQMEDTLIFASNEDVRFDPVGTDDGNYLLLNVSQGTAANTRWYYKDINRNDDFIPLINEADAIYEFIGNDGSLFYFTTTLNAPRGRIIAIDLEAPLQSQWEEVLPEQQADVLQYALLISDVIVTVFSRDVHHILFLYSRNGAFLHEIPLPLGSIHDLSGEAQGQEFFFKFSSYLDAGTIYRYDFTTALETFWKTENGFNTSSYIVSQQFYPSEDGTRIPMFLVHKKDLVLDGSNPTLLVGYGGFKLSQWPTFSTAARFWIEHGGIYAVANVRGGGEYGEEWHQAGSLLNKRNSFNDFIAAAEWLIEMKYTSPGCLAINGWSNGGLLVAACLVQRPELFGAVAMGTPLSDMVRYAKLCVGFYWIKEFGNAEENADHFQFLLQYSPYHNAREAAYPPTLIVAGAADDRVAPAHSMKLAAKLQLVNRGHHPILLYLQSDAGHAERAIERWAVIFTFLFDIFHINPSTDS